MRLPPGRRPRRRRGGSTSGNTRLVGRARMRLVVAVVVVASLFLSGRAGYLTFAEEGRYEALAAERVASETTLERGDILSADGRKLATSLEVAQVVATPYQVEEPRKTSRSLFEVMGAHTGLSQAELEEKVTGGGDPHSGYSVVARNVPPKVAEKVQDLSLPGIEVSPSFSRTYPDGRLASQLTGHLGSYGEPFGGVESRYDERLANGEDVKLTVNAAVQQKLETTLLDTMRRHDASSAMGLVMRVEDGKVVALANVPGYNNNDFGRTAPDLQRNRVLTDPYEPGSTLKPFAFAAALEEDAISPGDSFTVPDHIQVADRIIHDSEPHATKVMGPEEILEASSNVGTIEVALRLGGRELHRYLGRFGFGEKTGIELWGEDAGTLPAYEDWSGSSIGNIPIGQGVAVTPLQLAAGYAALANGGHRVTPYITESGRAEPGPRVISRGTSDIVSGMLRSVVEEGTGHLARIPGYPVAGKTGTSQKVDPSSGTYGDEYVASFIGFAPAEEPEYVALIVVDEPQDIIWGERVAAPAFRKVMKFTLGYYNVPPDSGTVATR
jgi:cell division protein FtsI (penicillin-binding protein 3)